MAENKLQFPLTVRTDSEEFIINKEDDPTSPSQFLSDFDGDRGRSKRRRRCGQCGPCQVKENCNKCNFCMRRDILKQTCIYRKCVYLRSKPKPYPSPQGGSELNRVTSPPNQSSVKSLRTSSAGSASDGPNISNHSEQISQQTIGNFNPFSSMNPLVGSSFLSSDSLFKPPVPQTSHAPQTSVVVSSPEPLPPQISPYNSQNMPQIHSGHNPMTLTSSDVSGKTLPLVHVSQQNSCSSFSSPLTHHHLQSDPLKYDAYFNRYSRTTTNESRTNLPSPCMYHPGFPGPYRGTTGPVDRNPYGHYVRPPTIPPYLPSNSNMLRHFTSLPQGYPIPPPAGRYVDGYAETPPYPTGYNGFGIQPPDMQMPIHSMSHHHPFNSYSNINRHQPPQYEQSSTCPKNVFGPPAFPSLALGTLRVQERPHGIHSFRCNPFYRPLPWDEHYFHPIRRPNSTVSNDSKASSVSSGFECDVISIDNLQINAYIRSDGCNSIEIEIDNPSSPTDKQKTVETQNKSLSQPDINCNYKSKPQSPRKITLTGIVTLKQDLGEEGIVQLDIPGNKVTLEESWLDNSLAKYSCNIVDLLKFIESEPRNELESQN